MKDLSPLLVANRGEIAVRIMRTARALGLRTVAVYSDADADAPHVRAGDDAVRLGPAPVAVSYLDAEKVLDAARASGAKAIHPGYGFLSENAAFARAVEAAGLIFVGPPAEAITIMGDKARAKRAMIAAGVPCVPGYEGEDQDDARFIEAAAEIGFPVMVKAAAGGGGRGMRLVTKKKDLAGALEAARSEAENAFGSGDLILEKAIVRPRHVEIQVFADAHGNVVHLGERDCSVQRRHQKVIEEAPSPVMTPELRDAMGAAAVEAARAARYCGAGTVEFLLDAEGAFYFLEMNTRLQVEHPVTEMVTGLDLVELQLRAAAGARLGLEQADVALTGHAIEARLYAEDPAQDFLPSAGDVVLWAPATCGGVRVDAGIATGGAISAHYDPMAAKIIAHGATREEARRRLVGALGRTALFGPKTNRDFLIDALNQPTFIAGEATTAFIEEAYGAAGYASDAPNAEHLAAAAVLQHLAARDAAEAGALVARPELRDWSSTGPLPSVVVYEADGEARTLEVSPTGSNAYVVACGVRSDAVVVRDRDGAQARLLVNGRGVAATSHRAGAAMLHVALPDASFVVVNGGAVAQSEKDAAGGGAVTAPMHGKLLEIAVAAGDAVKRGDRLCVLEAMKMQHVIAADIDGTVAAVHIAPGAQVDAGALILEIEEAS